MTVASSNPLQERGGAKGVADFTLALTHQDCSPVPARMSRWLAVLGGDRAKE